MFKDDSTDQKLFNLKLNQEEHLRFSKLITYLSLRRSQNMRTLIAIDGYCGSGKTTLAIKLSKLFNANIYHLDDFYLTPKQKALADKTKAGWNSNHHRFINTVLLPLSREIPVIYSVYNCKTNSYLPSIKKAPSTIEIIEGAYAHHPLYRDFYDYKVFLDIASDLQQERILKRNGKEGLKRFNALWIPLEKEYFKAYQIKMRSDLVITQ